MHYNTLVIKFKKEYFVDLISSRLGFTAKKKIYIYRFCFLISPNLLALSKKRKCRRY